jgi:hypothetical protein
VTVDNCALLYAVMNDHSDEGGIIYQRVPSGKHGEL